MPVRTKVGHSFIKQMMAETGAVFGGEHSAHYYFRDNFGADSGLIASLLVLDEISRADTALSVVRKPFERYSSSGEINTASGRRRTRSSTAVSRAVHRSCTRIGSTGSPSTAGRGGSTCARRTPSRCCASTSKQPTATSATSACAEAALGPRHERLTTGSKETHHGTRPPAARDSRLPRGQGSAVLPRRRRRLYNPRLRRRYVVRDGIPVMLIDEADAVDDAEHERIMARVDCRRPGADIRGVAVMAWSTCRVRDLETSWDTLTP